MDRFRFWILLTCCINLTIPQGLRSNSDEENENKSGVAVSEKTQSTKPIAPSEQAKLPYILRSMDTKLQSTNNPADEDDLYYVLGDDSRTAIDYIDFDRIKESIVGDEMSFEERCIITIPILIIGVIHLGIVATAITIQIIKGVFAEFNMKPMHWFLNFFHFQEACTCPSAPHPHYPCCPPHGTAHWPCCPHPHSHQCNTGSCSNPHPNPIPPRPPLQPPTQLPTIGGLRALSSSHVLDSYPFLTDRNDLEISDSRSMVVDGTDTNSVIDSDVVQESEGVSSMPTITGDMNDGDDDKHSLFL